ncbi:MAG: hypothetical protein ACREXR_15005, partial [Gammaproteobacteria bacterium]
VHGRIRLAGHGGPRAPVPRRGLIVELELLRLGDVAIEEVDVRSLSDADVAVMNADRRASRRSCCA